MKQTIQVAQWALTSRTGSHTNLAALGWAWLSVALAALRLAVPAAAQDDLFTRDIAPLLQKHCVGCHGTTQAEGGFSLATRSGMLQGGDSGEVVVPGSPEESYLWELISGGQPEMPKNQSPLTAEEQELMRRWIVAGAPWPPDFEIADPVVDDLNWWSLRSLIPPPMPPIDRDNPEWVLNEVDGFVLAQLREQGLTPSPAADRATLIRRVYFDLIGLPPTSAEVQRFLADDQPQAYERLVDSLLASPHYGERWARHWLDVAHYGDSHGYDKDQPRPNAWPYRDYVIRSFNADKPYARFVQEQIAGDVLWPETRDGIEATGFIAAGPWDLIGHAEVPESKLDGQVARNLDRDDMVSSTMTTFNSLTVHCARCHNHKFDPVSQEHYYSLQAVFAALDRTDREYDVSSDVAEQRRLIRQKLLKVESRLNELTELTRQQGGPELARLDEEIARWNSTAVDSEHPAYGYHSQIEATSKVAKWVQVDLGEPRPIARVRLMACRDNFAGIGAGFGFPPRFTIQASDDSQFQENVVVIADHSQADFPNPGVTPVEFIPSSDVVRRYVRVTATQLAFRADDFIMALAELEVTDPSGHNWAFQRPVTALDSIEMPPRWRSLNLVDGIFVSERSAEQRVNVLQGLREQREAWLTASVSASLLAEQVKCVEEQQGLLRQLAELPAQQKVYCGAIHSGSGTFVGTGAQGGQPREIRVLRRGDITAPGPVVGPGTVPIIPDVNWQFELPPGHTEGERRAALAKWLVRPDHPLTWRSIVNRVWLYHFGRGLVDSPNDFGRMGELPTHPELLEWLACNFRDQGGSFKQLHRLLVTSNTYRQASIDRPECQAIDGDNRFYWKMNRRLLDAESIRDATLLVSGRLDTQMFGPPFRDFIVEHPEHSPHYQYDLHDPRDPATHRRSIYRLIVRSQQQPFLQTMDCADPSESVAKRNTTLTALQALTVLNNRFMVTMAEYWAERAVACESDLKGQIRFLGREALGRELTEEEAEELVALAREWRLPYACRLLMNLNEFVFVD